MTQVSEKSDIELQVKENKQHKVELKVNEKNVDDLLGDLNPRYFEENMNMKKAKQKLWAKNGNYFLR